LKVLWLDCQTLCFQIQWSLHVVAGVASRIIMTTALKHSMGALFWASIILLVVEVMLALLFLHGTRGQTFLLLLLLLLSSPVVVIYMFSFETATRVLMDVSGP